MTLQFKTNIDKKGNVHLPDEILKTLHLDVEDSVTIAVKDGKITLQPLHKDPEVIEKNGLLVIHPQITGELADAARQNRKARIKSVEDTLK